MATKQNTALASGGFNLGNLDGYSAGGGVPEGDYVIKDWSVQMFQAQKRDGSNAGPARLGVIITLVPLGGGEEKTQFYSMGSNADQSWAPNPQTGKGIVAVPGGPGTPPNKSTNWALLIQSLYDSGLPQGILSDDLSVLDGIHVHMSNVPEPEDRKGFQSRTGDAVEERKNKTIAVVTEIKDDGKPWEGTGGVPTEKVAPTKAAKVPAAVATTHNKAVAATRAAIATDDAPEDTDTFTIALSAASDILGNNPNGMLKAKLRIDMFKSISDAHDAKTANTVLNTIFKTDQDANGFLNQLGYKVSGLKVEAA